MSRRKSDGRTVLRKDPEKQNIFSAHRIAFCIFFFLLAYGLIVVRRCAPPSVSNVCYYFHTVDFSLGFCSRFLPGAIYHLFFRTPSPATAAVYETVLLVLLYAAVSLLLEKLMLAVPERYRRAALVLLAFYLTGPATFAPYAYKIGMLDVYWLFLTVPFLLMLRNRYARLALPLLFLPAVMIHFGAMFTYVPFYALLILYEQTRARDKSDRRRLTAVFLAGCVLAAGLFLYFGVFEKSNVKVDIDTFDQMMRERGVENTDYYDYALYGTGDIDVRRINEFKDPNDPRAHVDPIILFPEHADNAVVKLLNFFFYHLQMHYYLYTTLNTGPRTLTQYALLTVVLLPALFVLWRFFFVRSRRMKEEGQKLKRFVYVCLILFFPVATVGSMLISSDSTRWCFHVYFLMFTTLLYLMYRERETVPEIISGILKKIPEPVIGLYFLLCFFTVVNPYV